MALVAPQKGLVYHEVASHDARFNVGSFFRVAGNSGAVGGGFWGLEAWRGPFGGPWRAGIIG